VTTPVSSSVTDLRDQILAMLEPAPSGNDSAAEVAAINNLSTIVTNMKTKVDSLDDKVFYEPKIVDESDVNMVYNGYALPGASPEQAVWAIQKVTFANGFYTYEWAGGNKNFDKKWSDRNLLSFS
jgi:hypothetical protein